ncbi:Uncharacterised protein [Mycobacteroides abscessus subsp. abscessus]|uniref:hypothetical protein n=1 Tax=Mycobacteroides abscessus TaxID=36809 RepID=UPI0009A6D559|nr:hypothetical protein [Mycobacteroides abscessus]SLJ23775.1 Uncharacterised protein [Mycobacteroides abscessus subsp. abscessus]
MPATFTRTLLFAEPADVAAIASVIGAITETKPAVRTMTRRDGFQTDRHEFDCGGTTLQVMAGDARVPALLEFRVPDQASLTAAMERVRAAGHAVEPWPSESDPVHAVVTIGALEINVQRNAG